MKYKNKKVQSIKKNIKGKSCKRITKVDWTKIKQDL